MTNKWVFFCTLCSMEGKQIRASLKNLKLCETYTIYLANLQEKSLSSSAELFKLSVMIMKVRFDITPMSTLMVFAYITYNMIILNHPVSGVVAAAALPRRHPVENPSWPWAKLLRKKLGMAWGYDPWPPRFLEKVLGKFGVSKETSWEACYGQFAESCNLPSEP